MLNAVRSSVQEWFLRRLRRSLGLLPVRLILPDGGAISLSHSAPLAELIIRDQRTLAKLVFNPEIGFGEAYEEGRLEVHGDLVSLIEMAFRAISRLRPRWYSHLATHCLNWTQGNTLRAARKNIHHHYDLSNDFYKLWLDRQLVYTCAYFPSPSSSLEEAQIAKMDHVCRKVQLEPGETVVEAGCGWGALALHMARHYGVRVKAFNISREQILFARQRASEEGLTGQVEFIEDDYRNISGRFDVFMSVGMLEHVGRAYYTELGRMIHRVLGNCGRGLLHFIGRNYPRPLNAWIRKRIFPGAYPPTLRDVMDIFEPWDFSVLDVENLRLHYAKTLEHWLDRFEASAERVSEMFDTRFTRAWQLYLAGSVAGFRAGTLQLFQVLFAAPQCRKIPWTRAHLYSGATKKDQEPQWIHVMS